ncbi:TetR/AcrR family transcriptional regulator [Sphingomonas naphthae]|uniref:TetR/AcrR family transcriptional regulator n=1 Tax=Sphingomonas naphthae TaxID=1813468 RepID=A0ABY7TK49_9SPHN|nr:TetR/AcrR family transcriptional regulator [Sphingomonas naphthae]WCT72249.1 TetR/AcrR family transcriptional regulator [Sphingomonas naphthae]
MEAPAGVRGEPLRRRVLDAAEQLLRQGRADFSMRDLAAEAAVSFATPFNQFGSKAAIMHALSGRRIDTMEARYAAVPRREKAPGRVLLAMEIAATVMVEAPEVNRTVMGWLGASSGASGQALTRSTALWAVALGAGDGLHAARRAQALRDLPGQLAIAFRGVLSFWTAGEIGDEALAEKARDIAKALLLGLAEERHMGS